MLVWRRSYDIAPNPLAENDLRNPRFDYRYHEVPDAELPRTESLKDTIERIMPYWESNIFPALKTAHTLLVVAHGNIHRAVLRGCFCYANFRTACTAPALTCFRQRIHCV